MNGQIAVMKRPTYVSFKTKKTNKYKTKELNPFAMKTQVTRIQQLTNKNNAQEMFLNFCSMSKIDISQRMSIKQTKL